MVSSHASLWQPAPEHLTLETDEVHVWRASLEQKASAVAEFRRLLAEDERRRADRFHFTRDREHFVVARGILRTLLARYLDRRPERLRFIYSAFGKPSLEEEAAGAPVLRFNVSHSKDLALYAFTRGREIGVDIEHIRDDVEGEDIAERFFSPAEVGVLRSLPSDARPRAFFDCWTRKEAYIKAHGEGLSLPLDGFDVTLSPNQPAALLATRHDPTQATRWSLRELSPSEGYAAALAVEGDGWQLKCWQW
ncbi:MAG TPA: 4'-phosphopantetheinyl transferase superfamily protein [Pyrinomonadaceae bacterium]|jgi:4'-phosphopantetheinyl transferase